MINDIIEEFSWSGDRNLIIKINKDYKTIKVGEYFFPSVEDLNTFINKLSDISESLTEGESK